MVVSRFEKEMKRYDKLKRQTIQMCTVRPARGYAQTQRSADQDREGMPSKLDFMTHALQEVHRTLAWQASIVQCELGPNKEAVCADAAGARHIGSHSR